MDRIGLDHVFGPESVIAYRIKTNPSGSISAFGADVTRMHL